MSLITHFTIQSPATLSNDDPDTTQTKINDNHSLWQSEMTDVEERLEDTVDTLFGAGLTSTPSTTYSDDSLSVTVGAFTCLIGAYISYAGGAFTALANQTNATMYFCQDSTWSSTLPTTKSYLSFCTYSSDADGVTELTLSDIIVIPQYVSISDSDTVTVPESAGYYDYQIDHSALASFITNGFIKLEVDSDDYYAAILYSEPYADGSDTEHTAIHGITETTFWVRVTRKSGYYYSDDSDCVLTYTRTGLVS
jgi:hypothetical protein